MKNSFRKYVAYAFGELLMVVLGILIAMRVTIEDYFGLPVASWQTVSAGLRSIRARSPMAT